VKLDATATWRRRAFGGTGEEWGVGESCEEVKMSTLIAIV
jgi:hypothetical protein